LTGDRLSGGQPVRASVPISSAMIPPAKLAVQRLLHDNQGSHCPGPRNRT
jgi:hypothetical protein